MKRISFLPLFLLPLFSSSQISVEKSVMISAEVNDTTLTLEWEHHPSATAYTVAIWDGNRFDVLETLDSQTSSWEYKDFKKGETYEFRVVKFGTNLGYGYAYVGHEVMPVIHRGRCLLLVDSLLTAPLSQEIDQWVQDVEGDGWTVQRISIGSQSHFEVKETITNWYMQDNRGEHRVFILGHIAVPYSGNIAPDGHPDHIGAWPCDGYYADMDGTWTDVSINNTAANDVRNDNIPGDGKFDQSTFPSDLEIGIGRVDLSDLPAFQQDYVELTRTYLNKNHEFRTQRDDFKRRALVENNFASFAEGFGQNGWKNFVPMFGRDSVFRLDYESTLAEKEYLCAYACGAGSYTSMGGVGNINSLYRDREIKTVFAMNFGSYFGDWDKRNNLLRGALASGTVLCNAWAGRPNWQFHHMALGKDIGYSARESMDLSMFYFGSAFGKGVHTALMGDPTLRLHTVVQPQQFIAEEKDFGVALHWAAGPDDDIYYQLLRKEVNEQEYVVLTPMDFKDTTFFDSCLNVEFEYEYVLKAMKLERSASGTYYNTSVGLSNNIKIENDWRPSLEFDISHNYEVITFSIDPQSGVEYQWDFGDGASSAKNEVIHQFEKAGTYEVCLTAISPCGNSTNCVEVQVESSLPSIDFEIIDVKCYGDSTGAIEAIASNAPLNTLYLWNTGDSTSQIQGLKTGYYELTIISENGTQCTFDSIHVHQPDSISLVIRLENAPAGGTGKAIVDTIFGGTPSYTLLWDDGNADPDSLSVGLHTLLVTDNNGCQKEIVFEIKSVTSTTDITAFENIYPNPTDKFIHFEFGGNYEVAEFWLNNGQGAKVSGFDFKVMEDRLTLDVHQLPAGIYALTVMMKSKVQFNSNFIKQ